MSRRFIDAILEVQQKTGQKNILLQRRIETLASVAEYRDVIIGELRALTSEDLTAKNLKLEVILEIIFFCAET